MANEETINRVPAGSGARVLADGHDPDLDSGNGDDQEHWLKVEDLLRQRRSNLLDFGLPPGLARGGRIGR